MEDPPHSHLTVLIPTSGIADRVPVITVAPQNDICPQGRTYPKNAVAIIITIRIIPDNHVFFWFWGEEKYSPRAVWMYINMNNKDAVFACNVRIIHPRSMSFMINIVFANAFSDSGKYSIERMIPVAT